MADSLQLPPELHARLAAAGVTDQDSLETALRADPDLERDYRAFLKVSRAPERSEQIRQLLTAFVVVPDRNALAQLWRRVPLALEDALLNAVETEIVQQEQAGGTNTSERLRQWLEEARQMKARWWEADRLIRQAVEALVTIPDDQLADLWLEVPLSLEDAILSVAKGRATNLELAGQSAAADQLVERVEALRQFQELQRQLRSAPPAVGAVVAFLQAPTDDDARHLFAAQRMLLQLFDAQQIVENLIAQLPDEEHPRFAKRAALLRTVRGAGPQPEPAGTIIR